MSWICKQPVFALQQTRYCTTSTLTVLCAQKHLPRVPKGHTHSRGIDSVPILSPLWRPALYQQGCCRPQPHAGAECEAINRGSPAFHSHQRMQRACASGRGTAMQWPPRSLWAGKTLLRAWAPKSPKKSLWRVTSPPSFSLGYTACCFSFHQKKRHYHANNDSHFFEVATLKCALVDANASANREKWEIQPSVLEVSYNFIYTGPPFHIMKLLLWLHKQLH